MRRDQRQIFWLGIILIIVGLVSLTIPIVLLSGCATVHQSAVQPQTTSLHAAPLKIAGGYVLDAYWRDTYNGLVAVYGEKKLSDGAPVFVPPLKKDDGLTAINAEQWMMTDSAMQNFTVLSDLKRRGAAP